MIKRAFDVIASVLGLVLLAPITVACAVWIRIDSPGPVFFRQLRVGRYGVLFRIHKFRTMSENAERLGDQLTTANDARVTASGKVLRRWKIDELPQLLDVLLGAMSIVGPRPEVPKFVAYYPDDVREVVLSVRPGITDLASVHFRDESALLDGSENAEFYTREILPLKLRYYTDYVNHRSFWGDMRIIMLTLAALLGAKRQVDRPGAQL